jgi:hypothetical protein
MLVLTTVWDSRINGRVGGSGTVVPLVMDQPFHAVLDALDAGLNRHPPTSIAHAHSDWLLPAQELGRLLSLQAARAGVPIDWDRVSDRFSGIVMAAERVIPIDLTPSRHSLLGTRCVVSHALGLFKRTDLDVLHFECQGHPRHCSRQLVR